MRIVRAILGRLARLLVRLARTLDPGAAPASAGPLRMAALRQRYPGAPDHWLELLARRTSLGEAPAQAAHRAEADAGGRGAARPAPRFAAPAGSNRDSAAPTPAEVARRPRPTLAFAALRGRRMVAEGRGAPDADARRDGVRFIDADPARREHRTFFPDPDQATAPEPSWPEFRFSAPPGPIWPGAGRAARPEARFAVADNRWPDLPVFLDELGATELRASDEAALIAEQMSGKWSA